MFDRVLAPGALYGAMAVSVPLLEGAPSATVEDLRLHNPLVFPTSRGSDTADDDLSVQAHLGIGLDSPRGRPIESPAPTLDGDFANRSMALRPAHSETSRL